MIAAAAHYWLLGAVNIVVVLTVQAGARLLRRHPDAALFAVVFAAVFAAAYGSLAAIHLLALAGMWPSW